LLVYVLRFMLYTQRRHGYQSTRHTVNSSHTRLITQSTRHKQAHNKATSRNFFYLHSGQVALSAQHGWGNYGKRAYKTYAIPSIWV